MPGKTWKCRSCQSYNPKVNAVCGQCGDPMRILMGGGSSREDPVHSHEQIPQQGYGDGKGNFGPRGKSYGLGAYYAAKGAASAKGLKSGKLGGYSHLNEDYLAQAGPYGYAPNGQWSYGYGPLAYFSGDYGYGPMQQHQHRAPGSPSTHGGKGGKSKGKEGKPVTIGAGKGKGRTWTQEQEQQFQDEGEGHSNGTSQQSRSSQQGGAGGTWANRRLRREEASRSRSRSVVEPTVVVLDVDDLMEDVTPAPVTPATSYHSPSPAPGSYSPASPAPATPEWQTRIGFGIGCPEGIAIGGMDDAKAIRAHMESVQCLIIALKGKTDEYSMKCRASLESDLHLLRIRTTKLKPLEDQNAILEALVEKRTTHFTQSEHNVQTAIAEMETARTSLQVAQQQLIQVRQKKAEVDAAATAAKEAETRKTEAPDNVRCVAKAKDLVCLLPNEMKEGFAQCLANLEILLQQASASTVTHAATIDSFNGSGSEFTEGMVGMEHIYVPQFPGGERPLHELSADESSTERQSTPPARGRAEHRGDPERSPVQRSRSNHSASRSRAPAGVFHGKAESMEEHFSRREPLPISPP